MDAINQTNQRQSTTIRFALSDWSPEALRKQAEMMDSSGIYMQLNQILSRSESLFADSLELLSSGNKESQTDFDPTKQRFADIYPYAHNNLHNFGSWIGPGVAACQWPKPQNLRDFYASLIADRVSLVIALGQQNRDEQMLDYWSPRHADKHAADFQVQPNTASSVDHDDEQCDWTAKWGLPQLQSTTFTTTRRGTGQKQCVEVIRFPRWQDYSAPPSSDIVAVLELAKRINQASDDSAAFVHCRAGVGRSGTVLMVAWGMRELERLDHEQRTAQDSDEVQFHFFNLWMEMRLRRSHLCQVPGQLSFVLRALAYWRQHQCA